MFGHRFFGSRFYGPDYWGDGGDAPPPPPVVTEVPGGSSKRKKRRVIRLSDLDERERQEALAAIPVRPFTELEQAAVALGEADEDEIEEADDALLMAMVSRILQ